MDRVFIIGRDQVPQFVRLESGEKLRWTLVFCPSLFLDGRSACCSGAASPLIPAAPLQQADGCGERKMTIEVDLCGPGAGADIAGLYLCPDSERLELNVLVRHVSGGCVSRQLFKGIAGGTSRASFNGLIYVARDAQKTKAYQENHTILLSDRAKVETRPQLEIYADDVECSHGATTGFLNADELFYMRSRGIPEEEARRLQMISFLAPVLERLPEELRDEIISQC